MDCCSQGSCQTITYESQVTLHLKWLQPGLHNTVAGKVFAAAECAPQVVQVGDKSSLQEEFIDFCTSPLPVTAITEVDKYSHAISQIKDCVETE